MSGLRRSDVVTLVKTTITGWSADKVPRLGASLAFYTILSLAPMIVVVLAVAGMVFGRQAAQGELMWQIEDLVGHQGALAIQNIIEGARSPVTGAAATALGLLTLFVGSTAAVNELRDALNTVWHVPGDTRYSGWRSLIGEARNRLFSFAIIVGVGFFLLVSLLVNAWVAAAGPHLGAILPAPGWLIEFVNSAVSFVVIAFVFAVLYKALPDVPIEWGDVAVGALATSALFTLGKYLIGIYLGRTSLANAYGAAGSLVVVLLWVYYSAQVFFLGAEFTYVYTCHYGSKFRRKLDLAPNHDARGSACPISDEKPEIVLMEHVKSEKG